LFTNEFFLGFIGSRADKLLYFTTLQIHYKNTKKCITMKTHSIISLQDMAAGLAVAIEIPAKLKGRASPTLGITGAGSAMALTDQKLWQEIPTNRKRPSSPTSRDTTVGIAGASTDKNLWC
jgi:hypothetical protein